METWKVATLMVMEDASNFVKDHSLSLADMLVIPKGLLNFQLQIRSDRNLSASTNILLK